MDIMIVSCVFPPEPVVSAKTSEDLAIHLSSINHNVTVVCPKPNRNVSNEDFDLNIKKKYSIEYIPTLKSYKSTLLSRFSENISFAFSIFFKLIFSKKN